MTDAPQTPLIRETRALACMDRARTLLQDGDNLGAARELESAAKIACEPVKDEVFCRDPEAGSCGLCTCWKLARDAAT